MKRNKLRVTSYKWRDRFSTFFYLLPLFLSSLLFIACGNPAMFEQNVDLPESAWAKDGMVHIILPVSDTLNYYNFDLTIRNSEDYPYANIYLFIITTAPNGVTLRDTVQYQLADERGKWLGKNGRHWFDHRLRYRSQTRFMQPGNYQFSIQHGMRADTLRGIGAVGLRVEEMR